MLSLELGKENKLEIRLKGKTTRTFSLPIIELEEKEQKIPDLKFPVTIKMASSMLNDAIEDANIVAESVTFQAEPKKFLINAEGDLSQANIEMAESDNLKINVEGSSKIRAKYSIEYLKKMVTGSKLSEEVSIQFNSDYPLKLEYKTVDKVMLSFILAPRVESS
jgi:proliferating cell nuclear antigen